MVDVETFLPPDITPRSEPFTFNGEAYVVKYRVRVEVVHEQPQVHAARLRKLLESPNIHSRATPCVRQQSA